jgi:hypothetical protein
LGRNRTNVAGLNACATAALIDRHAALAGLLRDVEQ